MSLHASADGPRQSRILIVDDHPVVREGLAALIEDRPHLTCCGEADSVAAALNAIEMLRPDLVLVDISLKASNGLDLIKRVRTSYPAIKLLVVSVHADEFYAARALRAGAMGYLNKQAASDQLIDAITSVLDGRVFVGPELSRFQVAEAVGSAGRAPGSIASLSDREMQVFEAIGRGCSTRAIADELNLSVHTIDTYRDKIKTKLRLQGTPALIQRAVQWVLEDR